MQANKATLSLYVPYVQICKLGFIYVRICHRGAHLQHFTTPHDSTSCVSSFKFVIQYVNTVKHKLVTGIPDNRSISPGCTRCDSNLYSLGPIVTLTMVIVMMMIATTRLHFFQANSQVRFKHE